MPVKQLPALTSLLAENAEKLKNCKLHSAPDGKGHVFKLKYICLNDPICPTYEEEYKKALIGLYTSF